MDRQLKRKLGLTEKERLMSTKEILVCDIVTLRRYKPVRTCNIYSLSYKIV